MPRVAVPVTSITRAGIAPAAETSGDATNNHSVQNNGKMFLLVRNSNGASTSRTVTLRLNGSIDGQSVTPRTVTIAAAASRYIGPFPTSTYGTSLLVDVDNAELKLSAYTIP